MSPSNHESPPFAEQYTDSKIIKVSVLKYRSTKLFKSEATYQKCQKITVHIELFLIVFMVLCSQLTLYFEIKFLWLLKRAFLFSCTSLIFSNLSAPITVSSQIIIRRRSFTKKTKAGDVSRLHWTMPDECSFFCSKAGISTAVLLLPVLQQCPPATVLLGRHKETVPVQGNMQSAPWCSPSVWCQRSELSGRSKQSLQQICSKLRIKF